MSAPMTLVQACSVVLQRYIPPTNQSSPSKSPRSLIKACSVILNRYSPAKDNKSSPKTPKSLVKACSVVVERCQSPLKKNRVSPLRRQASMDLHAVVADKKTDVSRRRSTNA